MADSPPEFTYGLEFTHSNGMKSNRGRIKQSSPALLRTSTGDSISLRINHRCITTGGSEVCPI